MPTIHPTSVIEPGAVLAPGVQVGPLCYVGAKAVIGAGTRLVSHVAVLGRTRIGAGNTLWPHAVAGGDPQDLKFQGEETELVIGDHNDIREGVTLHIGTANGGSVTRIGDHNLIMVGAHVAHDCAIGSHTILANAVQLAGHVCVDDHAIISGATAVHSFVTIGKYAYVGGLARVTRDVPPFMVFEGNPARVRAVNTVGLGRHHFDPQSIARLKEAYHLLFKPSAEGAGVGAMAEGLAQLEARYPDDQCIKQLAQFLRNSAAGLYGRYRETQRQDDRRQNPVK